MTKTNRQSHTHSSKTADVAHQKNASRTHYVTVEELYASYEANTPTTEYPDTMPGWVADLEAVAELWDEQYHDYDSDDAYDVAVLPTTADIEDYLTEVIGFHLLVEELIEAGQVARGEELT